jgi:hypothetical protein
LLVVKPLTMKTQNPQTFVLLPEETFEKNIKILEKIDRRETWFYERRKDGTLPDRNT